MPLKLCRTFINMGNKINSVKTVTGLLQCKCNLEIFQISGYKTYESAALLLVFHSRSSTVRSTAIQQLVLEDRKQLPLFVYIRWRKTTLNNPEGDPH